MPEIKINIPIPQGEWINGYLESKIPVGVKVSFDNVGSSDIYYTSIQDQPEVDFRGYNTLKPRVGKFSNNTGDPGLWFLALTTDGEVNVSIFIDDHEGIANELNKLLINLINKTHENQLDVLNQLKLINLNLSEISGNDFNLEDIDK